MPSPLPPDRPLSRLLTEREREVMAYVAAHHRSKTIARLTGKTPKTVDAQVASACRKLGVSSRVDAVRLLLEEGLDPMGENPHRAPSPMAAEDDPASFLSRHSRDANEQLDTDQTRDHAGRDAAVDELPGFPGSAGTGGVGPRASTHGAFSGFGPAAAGAFPERADADVRNPVLGRLPGGPAPEAVEQLGLANRPGLRLLIALGIALALAVAVPAALGGAVALQKLVETLQARP
ncbi:helix-turn-helix transcriptional regulator [uncultured Brevundimonas sp.]|uniref:response regulator transcription factor n=1 Tax=uncultured Brevundimonas sp. TaxID=213418 RepID=UPI00259244B9|nr:helix-turn-helix transcriptional regulator [uncultured Brevundimonas sp.]